MTALDELKARIAELEADNAKLRAEKAAYKKVLDRRLEARVTRWVELALFVAGSLLILSAALRVSWLAVEPWLAMTVGGFFIFPKLFGKTTGADMIRPVFEAFADTIRSWGRPKGA